MGMTIEEAIIALERDIHNAKLCGYQIDQYKVAIDTMRKHQKIQEIVEAWLHDEDIDSYDSMADIEEVVRDGNDD